MKSPALEIFDDRAGNIWQCLETCLVVLSGEEEWEVLLAFSE